MFLPWLEIPVKDISMQLPLSVQDSSVRIMFHTSEAITETIQKLENLKTLMEEMERATNV